MSKKPILVTWHDFLAPTGFANVAKNLLSEAYKDFDVHVVAINAWNKDQSFDESLYKEVIYTEDPEDKLNIKPLLNKVEELQPDVVFLFQDIYHVDMICGPVKERSPKTKIVSYFPIDGHPVFKHYKNIWEVSDILITYSDWAIQVLYDYLPQLKDKTLHKLYHGVDFNTFRPLSPKKIKFLRRQVNWNGKFVVSNINTYQPRKQLDFSIRAFSMFAKGYKECQDCAHWMPINFKTCELCMGRSLVKKGKKKDDVILYLHTMPQTRIMGNLSTDHILSHMENAGFDTSDHGKSIAINGQNINKGEVPESIVNEVYNCSDYNLSTAVGEGCGLSLLESAAVGVPSIAPQNSAIPEMLGPYGHLIPNKAVANFPYDNGHMRPLIDEKELTKKLNTLYKRWEKSGRQKVFKQEIVDRIHNEFAWDDKREFLMDRFNEALAI